MPATCKSELGPTIMNVKSCLGIRKYPLNPLVKLTATRPLRNRKFSCTSCRFLRLVSTGCTSLLHSHSSISSFSTPGLPIHQLRSTLALLRLGLPANDALAPFQYGGIQRQRWCYSLPFQTDTNTPYRADHITTYRTSHNRT